MPIVVSHAGEAIADSSPSPRHLADNTVARLAHASHYGHTSIPPPSSRPAQAHRGGESHGADVNKRSSHPAPGRWWTGTLGYLVTLLMAAAAFTFRYSFWTPSYISIPAYAEGHERLPFQGRILTGWLIRLLARSPGLPTAAHRVDSILPQYAHGPYFIALAVVVFVSMIGAALAVRALLLTYTGEPTFSSWASLLVIYCSYFNLVLGYGVETQPYDPLALALMCTGVWLALTDRLALFLILTAVSSFNRETTIFLPVFLALRAFFSPAGQQRSRRFLTAVLAAVLCAGVRLILAHMLAGSPREDAPLGGIFSVHLLSNLKTLLKPQMWPLFFSTFGFLLPLFLLEKRRIGDHSFERATAWICALWLAAMLIAGVASEIRIYNELTAWIAPCIALIAWNWWSERHHPNTLNTPEIQAS